MPRKGKRKDRSRRYRSLSPFLLFSNHSQAPTIGLSHFIDAFPPLLPPPHHRPHHNHNHSDSHAMHNCHRDEGAASQPQDNYCLCVTNTSTAVLFQSAAHCQNCYIQVFNIVRFLDWICVGNVLSWLMSRNFLQKNTAILIWTTGYWELVILFNLIFTMTLFGSIWLRLKRRKVVSI